MSFSHLKVVCLQHDRPSLPAQVGASGTCEERLAAVAVPVADHAGQPAARGTYMRFEKCFSFIMTSRPILFKKLRIPIRLFNHVSKKEND